MYGMYVCVCFFLFEMGYVSFKNESIVPGGHVFLVHVEWIIQIQGECVFVVMLSIWVWVKIMSLYARGEIVGDHGDGGVRVSISDMGDGVRLVRVYGIGESVFGDGGRGVRSSVIDSSSFIEWCSQKSSP